MNSQLLGESDLEVSRLAYGCMRISGSWDRNAVDAATRRRAVEIIEVALQAGYTLFDHADIYGDTACESLFGEALKLHPDWRERMVIVTKCGIRFEDEPEPGLPHRYDFSSEHILRSAEESLARLRIDRIDLLLLHRPDYLADPEEVARAFVQLRKEGKVREFGVSNFRPSLLAALQAALPFHLQVNQVEVHAGRLDCFTDGTLDQCLEKKIMPMAWSPLDRGRLATGAATDPADPRRDIFKDLHEVLDKTAVEYGTSRTAIALAWLLRHPSGIVPVIGTTNPEHIREAAGAASIDLDRNAWYRILRAARGEKLA